MKYIFCEQGTPEWFALREKRLTASMAQAIGNNGAGLRSGVTQLMAEYYSTAPRENYTNEHMERGHELEDLARDTYELLHGVSVEQVGFIEQDEFIGCSPDGLVGDDGGLEIKCLSDVKHYELILHGEAKIESKYKWQCQMNMLVSGRKWWDLCFFNPSMQVSFLVFRQYTDKEKQDKLKAGFESGKKMIKEQQQKYDDEREKTL